MYMLISFFVLKNNKWSLKTHVKKYVSDLKPSSCDRISQDGC